MSSITTIEKNLLETYQKDFDRHVRIIGITIVSASFITITALVVIACASACLILPGVNTMQQVILPAIVPASCAILLSIPLIVVAVKNTKSKNAARKQWIGELNTLSDTYLKKIEKSKRATFIVEQFFKKEWTKEYSFQIIDDLKKLYPEKKEDQTRWQTETLKILDEVKANIADPHRKKPKEK